MATIYLDTKENREKRKQLSETEGEEASTTKIMSETLPETVSGSIEVSFLRGQENDLTMYLQVDKNQDGDFSGVITVALHEMTNAICESTDYEKSRNICEIVAKGYKHNSNPSFYYLGSSLDPIEMMEANKDVSQLMIKSLSETIKKLEADLPKYASWIEKQKEGRELNKDWPPSRAPQV
ncbi:MAG: hypothetical protein K5905_14065 [Roseibium sp.]|uniref:hypothetical protein n=1 Tax=Roseibium sp. TaxID=1936156 RepID=UPI002622A596|nr:hypothetical protein [Roseibium sp.]MCV0426590.1 hypothetical protein [Roseibium sp.]